MKKIDQTSEWLGKNLGMFRCPVCGAPFQTVSDYQMICVNNHHLNINKHGYVYFLQRGVQSEYDRQMLVSRRALLNAGLFKKIIETIVDLMPADPQTVLDVGTGEGTPLEQIRRLRNGADQAYVGFDISRAGVQLATQLDPELFFCLADLRRLPFAGSSFTSVIELFSPSDYQEFERVLADGGTIYKVIPTENYLHEMRELLYPSTDQHQHYDNSAVKQLFKEHFAKTMVKNINYQFDVPAKLRSAMIQMSPLHWGRNVRKLTEQEIQQLTTVTVDVDLLIGRQK
jgi:23S rRNA (guanine745-N1)-methyltransferase